MPDFEPLDPVRHRELRVAAGMAASATDEVIACIAVPAEFMRLALDYPIVFHRDETGDGFNALCLLGFEQQENLFIEAGKWLTEKPLALVAPPLRLGPGEGNDSGIFVDRDYCVQMDERAQTNSLFDADGRATAALDEKIAALEALDAGRRVSAAFIAALQRHDLLVPFSLDVELNNGAHHCFVGYHLVDYERLDALSGGQVSELQAEGYLMPAFMAAASVGNLAKMIHRKTRRRNG